MSVRMLPTKAGNCLVCGFEHDKKDPHNVQSLHYQYAFYGQFGRWPNWWDATVSVTAEMRSFWFRELKRISPLVILRRECQPPACCDVEAIAAEILSWESSITSGQLIPMPTLEPITVQFEEMETAENE